MTEQKKLKHEAVGQIRYYWNLARFTRRFEIEIDAPPQVVAEQFAKTKQSPVLRGVVHPLRATIRTVKENGTYEFNLMVTKESSEDVRAIGRIIFSEGYDRTIICGYIRIGDSVLFSMLGFLFILFIMLFIGVIAGDPEIMVCIPVLFIPIGMVMLTPVKGDYNILVPSLEAIINEAQRAHNEDTDTIDLNLQMPAGNKSASNDYYESAQE